MLGSYKEWVRLDGGGYGLKGAAVRTKGLADRCDVTMQILFPERYDGVLDSTHFGARCCRDR
jgi:hypothetical protein